MMEIISLKAHNLFKELNKNGIKYCHWKSNLYLGQEQKKQIEFDLLVARTDVPCFESTLARLGYKRVLSNQVSQSPAIHHFYDYDEKNDILIHIHTYYQIITGESLTKNYRFQPLEQLLLENRIVKDDVPQPPKSIELIVFVLRMMIKHASLIEHMLAWRHGYDLLKQELEWLLADDNILPQALSYLEQWFPTIELDVFRSSIYALQKKNAFWQRFVLGRKLRHQLQAYARYPTYKATYLTYISFSQMLLRRLFKKSASKTLATGGIIVAFIGAEGTGKSTLVAETYALLSRALKTEITHLGKPPSTGLTFIPNSFLPLLRQLKPQFRTSRIESTRMSHISDEEQDLQGLSLFIYAIRSIMIAWDRKALATKLYRQAAKGSIIICDRYPSTVVGAMDSPRLSEVGTRGLINRMVVFLARIEGHIYQSIVPPDVVIQLSVPVEVAIKRNQSRQKRGKETEDYIRRRHETFSLSKFPYSYVYELDTNKILEQTRRETRSVVWKAL